MYITIMGKNIMKRLMNKNYIVKVVMVKDKDTCMIYQNM